MTETLFYQLERRTIDAILPGLIEKTIERGWRAVVKADSAERADAIDNLLWTYSEESFLPHAQGGDGDPKRQTVLITVEDENPNAAHVLFLVGGAMPPTRTASGSFSRVVLVFDSRDEHTLERARKTWSDAKDAGLEVTYWQESAAGKFEKRDS